VPVLRDADRKSLVEIAREIAEVTAQARGKGLPMETLSELALELEGPLAAAHDPADLHCAPEGAFTPAQRACLIGHEYLYGRCWSVFGGTNEIQRNIIARTLLG
jgi:hypothetical protein